MASLNQLVSQFAHEIGKPNNAAVREHIRNLLITTRNEVIRRSYENHSYIDKVLTQRYRVTLLDVIDGDIPLPKDYNIIVNCIKRTTQPVPKPVRLTNNLPFDRVSTVGFRYNVEIPFVKETSARFTSHVPGLKGLARYDYINGYIYIFPSDDNRLNVNSIVIEGAFEHPTEVAIANGTLNPMDAFDDNNEWLISEDMVGQMTEIITKRNLLQNVRETNEAPNITK